MKPIVLSKKPTSKTECIKLIISVICVVNNISLSETDRKILAYYIVYGLKEATDALLMSSKIVTGLPALRNAKTRLLRKGFLRRTKTLYKSYELNMNKDELIIENNMGVFLKIDNS